LVVISTSNRRATLFPYTTLFRSIHASYRRRTGGYGETSVAANAARTAVEAYWSASWWPVRAYHGDHFGLRTIHWPSSVVLHRWRSEEHTSELQSRFDIVCRLLLE